MRPSGCRCWAMLETASSLDKARAGIVVVGRGRSLSSSSGEARAEKINKKSKKVLASAGTLVLMRNGRVSPSP